MRLPVSLTTHLSHQQRQSGHLEGSQLFPHVRQHPQDCFTFWSRGQTSQRKTHQWLWLLVHKGGAITKSKKHGISGTTFQVNHLSPHFTCSCCGTGDSHWWCLLCYRSLSCWLGMLSLTNKCGEILRWTAQTPVQMWIIQPPASRDIGFTS